MPDSNVQISVTAIVESAVAALNKVTNTMGKVGKSIDSTSTKMYNFGHTVQEFGQNIYSIGQRATIGISAPIAGLAKTMISTGAEMTAMHQTYKTVFGDLTKEAQNWAKNLGKSVGLSGSIIDQTNLQFRKMAGAFGMTGKDALDFSEKWTKLTMDVSAFNDIPIDEATERMMSGLRGEADAVEKLGIFMGNTQLQAEMLNEGLKGQYSDLNATQKMTVLYNLAMKQTAQANGQAAREAVSYQNALANLKQSFKDLSEQFYMAVQPAVLDYMKQLNDLTDKLKTLTPEQMRFYANIAKWLVIIPPIVMYLGATVEGFGRLFKILSGTGKFIGKALAELPYLGTRLGLLWLSVTETSVKIYKAFTGLAGGVVKALRVISSAVFSTTGLIVAIIIGIAVAVYFIIKYWDQISAWTIKTWGIISQYLSGVWTNIVSIFGKGVAAVTPVLNSLVKSFTEVFTKYILPAYQTYIVPIVTFFVLIAKLVIGVITVLAQVLGIIFGGLFAWIVAIAKIIWVAVLIIINIFKVLWQIIAFVANLMGTVIAVVATIFLAVFGVISTVALAIGKVIEWLVMGIIVPLFEYIGIIIAIVVAWFINNLYNSILWCIDQIVAALKWWADIFLWILNNVINPVIQWIVSAFQWLAKVIQPVLDGVVGVWNSFSSGVLSAYYNYIKPAFDFIVNGLKWVNNQWTSIWIGIKNTFMDVVHAIGNAWKYVIDSFKLPHLTVKGDFSIMPPKVPSFGVNWYAKGGMFDSPSVIGVGEAGQEAVVPLTNRKTMSMLGAKVAEFMPDNAGSNGNSQGNVVIKVDGLVVREEADIEKIGQQLYKLQQRESRRLGRSDV